MRSQWTIGLAGRGHTSVRRARRGWPGRSCIRPTRL